MSVSIFASAVRPKLWSSLIKSLESTTVPYEIIFAGNNFELEERPDNFKYYMTGNIKPATCYEIARRKCTMETVVWFADDAEAPNNVIGKAYKYWKAQNNEKLILSIQTKESGYGNPTGTLFNMDLHRFFGGDSNSPLMAPLGLMSRSFLDELGGIDKRYVCGQYENDIVMRAYAKGAKVEIFGDADCYIDIDHLGKSIAIGESTDENNFRDRPFAKGYEQDRKILENSWCKLNQNNLIKAQINKQPVYPSMIYDVSHTQLDEFQPYPEFIDLYKSEEPKGQWE